MKILLKIANRAAARKMKLKLDPKSGKYIVEANTLDELKSICAGVGYTLDSKEEEEFLLSDAETIEELILVTSKGFGESKIFPLKDEKEKAYAIYFGADIENENAIFQSFMGAAKFNVWKNIVHQVYSEQPFTILPPGVHENDIFLDTETSGFMEDGGRIVEIGITDAYGRELYRHYFKSNREIDLSAAKVNKLFKEATDLEVEFSEEADKIYEILSNAGSIYIYNSPFDLGMLELEFGEEKMKPIRAKAIDVMPIVVQKLALKFPRISLQKACLEYGIHYVEKHISCDDCYMTIMLMHNL